MKTKKNIRYIFIAILLIVLIMVTVIMFNPLRRSKERIREQMLELIPIGTNMEDAIEIIDSNTKWDSVIINTNNGYILRYAGTTNEYPDFPPSSENMESDGTIGEQSIYFHMGGYRNIIAVSVVVYLGFDENGKLINAHIDKIYDGV